MISLVRSDSRGHMCFGWLKSYHSFSFGNYFNPERMGFGDLRVLNEDFIEPSSGFDTHSHENMEIITFVINGKIKHTDNLNDSLEIKRGEIQVMSAGSGIHHAEFNPSSSDVTHLYQIWIKPDKLNIEPSYQQKEIELFKDQLTVVASNDQQGLNINQEAKISYGHFNSRLELNLKPQKIYWLQIVSGSGSYGKDILSGGDAFEILDESKFNLEDVSNIEFLLFELKKS